MTTPSKADIREQLEEMLVIEFGFKRDDIVFGKMLNMLVREFTTTLTQHNEALLAALPRKQEIVLQQTKLTDYQTGYNKAIDQVTAIVRGSTHE